MLYVEIIYSHFFEYTFRKNSIKLQILKENTRLISKNEVKQERCLSFYIALD